MWCLSEQSSDQSGICDVIYLLALKITYFYHILLVTQGQPQFTEEGDQCQEARITGGWLTHCLMDEVLSLGQGVM